MSKPCVAPRERRVLLADGEQFHAQEQNLTCQACGAGPFARAAALMGHIEQGQCTRLDLSTIDQRRGERTEFSRQLEELTEQPVKHSFSRYIDSSRGNRGAQAALSARGTSPPSGTPCAETSGILKPCSGHGSAKAVASQSVGDCSAPLAPPGQGSGEGAKTTASLDPVIKTENATWLGSELAVLSVKDEKTERIFQKAPPRDASNVASGGAKCDATKMEAHSSQGAPRGPSKPQQGAMLGSEFFNSMDTDHPDHSAFNLARYYSPYAEMFLCPKMPCGYEKASHPSPSRWRTSG